MQTYEVHIQDRNYTNWSLYDLKNNCEVLDSNIPDCIDPVKLKLFNNDIICIRNDSNIVKTTKIYEKIIPGILILEGNNTYGRTSDKKRLYYKCIPYDRKFPIFIVPYDLKIGFSKHLINKYVLFRFVNWNDKHPKGILTETLGDVNKLEPYYEYQLHCKNLHISISELKNKLKPLNDIKLQDEYIQKIIKDNTYKIEDRTEDYVFSIDPKGSMDYDDAISIKEINDNEYCISVYIANVFIWIETLELWEYLTNNVSTIYLPDRKRPMLPTILSDSLCSLHENELRIALVMDIFINRNGELIKDKPLQYKNAVIKLHKNYAYEEKKLLKDNHYKDLLKITKILDNNVRDSHDLVEYWMIRMNTEVGNYMKTKEIGIFRKAIYTDENTQDLSSVNKQTAQIIKSWNNINCKYVAFNSNENLSHQVMNVSGYVHITSPIRRNVDLLNQIFLIVFCDLIEGVSREAISYLVKWINNLDFLNINMKSIRKVQSECDLLYKYYNNHDLLETKHECVLFGRTLLNNGIFSYMVYLPNVNILVKIKDEHEYSNLTKLHCKLFLFQDEDNMQKKIKATFI